jgi:hypothetical protein
MKTVRFAFTTSLVGALFAGTAVAQVTTTSPVQQPDSVQRMAFQSDYSSTYTSADPAVPAVPPVPPSPSNTAAVAKPAAAAPAGDCGCCNNGCCNDPNGCCDCCGPGTNAWDGTLKMGIGLRMSGNSIRETQPTAAPAILALPAIPTNTYNYFNPDDMRIYANGTAFGGILKGTLDTEVTGGGSFVSPDNVTVLALLDGIAQFEFNDRVNFWMGRFLPPTDRANLDGPFYQTPYDYPFVSNYPSLLAGRDDGACYWGQYCGGKLKWQLGMFNGIGRTYDAFGDALGPNATGQYMYMGRVTLNLLDPEPGYYTQSCYFGEKEILAIGMTAAFQRDGGGTAAGPADFNAESFDVLWEHKMGNCGVIDVEGAWYRYNYGITAANVATTPAASGAALFGTVNQGTSDYIQVSYLMPQNIGMGGLCGKLQPFARYQYYDRDFKAQTVTSGLSTAAAPALFEGVDVGVNWIVSGYNARTTVAWESREAEGGLTYSILRMGVQLQY